MYEFLRGELVETRESEAVLDVGGVGYRLAVPPSLVGELPARGEWTTFFTYLVVREDAMELYGFWRRETRELFALILGVAGVGPRLALNVVDSFTPGALAQAILEQDCDPLTRVPGVGPKTARRLALELKEKLRDLPLAAERERAGDLVASTGPQEEAAGALAALGYSLREARSAVSTVAEQDDQVEVLVKKALRQLGRAKMES